MKIIKPIVCPECGQEIQTPEPKDVSIRSMDIYKDTVLIQFKVPHICGEAPVIKPFEGFSL